MTRLAALLLPLLALGGPSPGPDVLEDLLGAWAGEGELFGRPARFSMTWSRTLDGRFLRLDFANRIETDDGSWRSVLEATAFYRVPDEGEELRGAWFDTRGEILELRATASDSVLVARWSASTEEGRTTYRVVDAGRIEVEDEVLGDGGWRRFGTATYRRGEGISPTGP